MITQTIPQIRITHSKATLWGLEYTYIAIIDEREVKKKENKKNKKKYRLFFSYAFLLFFCCFSHLHDGCISTIQT